MYYDRTFCFSLDDFNTYQFVKKLHSKHPRPVVIVGPKAEPICDKLSIDWVKRFARCFEGNHQPIFVCQIECFWVELFF